MPMLVVWVLAALIRLNSRGVSEAPSTWERRGSYGLELAESTQPGLGGPACLPTPSPTSDRYLGTAPRGAGTLATDAHAEALQAAIGVVGTQVERPSDTLVAQAPHHVVLQAQSWELQGDPQEGLPGASAYSAHIQVGARDQGSHGKSTCMKSGNPVNNNSLLKRVSANQAFFLGLLGG